MFHIKKDSLYVLFLALISITPPLSTDMYLAAIPHIALEWGVGKDVVNLTLVLWFVSFSLCMLLFGRLSDMYGRKPVLLGGLGVFVLSSFFCSTASDINMLILCRILQGAGAAAPSAMAVAISRDRFDGYTRQRVLAYIGVIIAVMPMVSPMIGAFLLKFASWRAIFMAQGLLGLVSFVISTGYSETLAQRASGGFFLIFSRYVELFRNREYILTNSAMGLFSVPFYGFIAFSPVAYIVHFGLSEKMFSMLFGLNALGIMLGSAACTRLTRRFSGSSLLTFGFAACVPCGLGLLIVGKMHYLAFAGFMLALTFIIGISRPISVSLIMEQVETDIGAASSFAVFYQFIVGALAMALVSMNWVQPFMVFSLIATLVPLLILSFWPMLRKMLLKNGSLLRLDTSREITGQQAKLEN